jgi:hypothetical protein
MTAARDPIWGHTFYVQLPRRPFGGNVRDGEGYVRVDRHDPKHLSIDIRSVSVISFAWKRQISRCSNTTAAPPTEHTAGLGREMR